MYDAEDLDPGLKCFETVDLKTLPEVRAFLKKKLGVDAK